MKSIVSVVQSTYPTAFDNISRGIELAGGLEGLKTGAAVTIKINMCDARTADTGAVTHPEFLNVILRYLREMYANLEIYVVESDATVVFADEFIHWLGYMPVLEKWGAHWHNLSKDETVETPIPNGRHLSVVPVPRLLKESYFISLSKLKTNNLSSITCSLKNQFGCLPMKQKSVFHEDLANVIADVNVAMRPDFSVVDGIIAHGSARGPAFGTPIRANVIVSGRDPVAVDCVCAKLLGFRPRRIDHIRLSAASGVGQMTYELVGDPMPQVDFEVDKLEMFQLQCAQWITKIQRLRFRQAWRKQI